MSVYRYKMSININEVETRRITISKKQSYGNKGSYKYFIRYIRSVSNDQLIIELPKMIRYTNEFNSDNIYENFLVQDKKI